MIGFIGLGIMGKPMVKNLLKAGNRVKVADVVPTAVEALAAEGAEASTQKEIGASCSVIFLSLPSGPVVQQVLFGENGVAESAAPGTVICDCSSVTPVESKICWEKLQQKGVGFVDCPMSGGETGAIAGTLAFMAGGREEDFRTVKPYLEQMGSSALWMGAAGSGSMTKLANQVIVNLTITAVSEALVLAVKGGVDPEKVYEAIRGGLAGSTVLDTKAPMMIARDFKPGGKISINHKDIKNVLATAHELDVPMPFTSQLFEVMQALKVGGHMDDDHSGIVQYFEQLADVVVKKPDCECR